MLETDIYQNEIYLSAMDGKKNPFYAKSPQRTEKHQHICHALLAPHDNETKIK